MKNAKLSSLSNARTSKCQRAISKEDRPVAVFFELLSCDCVASLPVGSACCKQTNESMTQSINQQDYIGVSTWPCSRWSVCENIHFLYQHLSLLPSFLLFFHLSAAKNLQKLASSGWQQLQGPGKFLVLMMWPIGYTAVLKDTHSICTLIASDLPFMTTAQTARDASHRTLNYCNKKLITFLGGFHCRRCANGLMLYLRLPPFLTLKRILKEKNVFVVVGVVPGSGQQKRFFYDCERQ